MLWTPTVSGFSFHHPSSSQRSIDIFIATSFWFSELLCYYLHITTLMISSVVCLRSSAGCCFSSGETEWLRPVSSCCCCWRRLQLSTLIFCLSFWYTLFLHHDIYVLITDRASILRSSAISLYSISSVLALSCCNCHSLWLKGSGGRMTKGEADLWLWLQQLLTTFRPHKNLSHTAFTR